MRGILPMKALVTTPDLNTRGGGVANFYRVLRQHLSTNVDYLTVGKRSGEHGTIAWAMRILRDCKTLARALRTRQYDMVHVNPSLAAPCLIRDGVSALAAKHHGLRVIIYFRGWDKNVERQFTGCKLWLFRKTLLQADAVIVLARAFADRLRTWGYVGPIYVETTVFDENLLDGFAIEDRLKDRHTSSRILFLARLVKEKGIYESLDAYAIVKKALPEISLTIAGDGPELRPARDYVQNKGIRDVDFAGYVQGEEKARVYKEADIYMFPTYGEGMPNSIMEAMAFGLPIITCPVGGIPDFFEDGKMGLLTESREPEVLARLLEKLLRDRELRIRMGRYNHEFAQERFAASKVAARLERIYDSVLRKETECVCP